MAWEYLLARASWDTDGVRHDLGDYVVGALGDTDAVVVFDETGDLKKGTGTVAAQRQYTGTAGRIENAQVAAYLAYAGARGQALIDRELYLPHLPRCWTDDPERLVEAGVPDLWTTDLPRAVLTRSATRRAASRARPRPVGCRRYGSAVAATGRGRSRSVRQ